MEAKSKKKETDVFRVCSKCGKKWVTRSDFLADPETCIVGYQASFQELVAGLFLFNHDCMTTLSVPVVRFMDLYDGPFFSQRMTGTDECPGHCLYKSDLHPCPNTCECAFVREILQILKQWPKAA